MSNSFKSQVFQVNGRVLAAFAAFLFAAGTASDWFPLVLTFPTFVIVLIQLRRIKSEQFVAADMFWLCVLFFFVVSPIQHILNYQFTSSPAAGIHYNATDFIGAEIIVVLSLLPIAYFGRDSMQRSENHSDYSRLFTGARAMFIIAMIISSFFAYVALSGGAADVAAPRNAKSGDSSFIAVLFLALMTVGTTLLAIKATLVETRNKVMVWGLFVIAASLLLFCVNPTNAPRFFNIATWLPVLLGLAGRRARYKYAYVSVFVGLLVIMPITSLTSRGGLSALGDIKRSAYAEKIFILKDIDVFDTLVHSVRMMHDSSFAFGKNVIAILLFFVPRTIWPAKPVVGGLVVGGQLHESYFAGTDNLSFYFGGDLYMDFGYLGVLIGAVIVAKLSRIIGDSGKFVVGGRNLISLLVIGSLPILVRGPVGAVIGYFVCLVVALSLYSLAIRARIKPVA